jgi:hypothetical protein
MPEGEERITEKESIMLTMGQNRKTPLDSSIDSSHKRQTSPSGSPPQNTPATTGENQGGGRVVEGDEEAR